MCRAPPSDPLAPFFTIMSAKRPSDDGGTRITRQKLDGDHDGAPDAPAAPPAELLPLPPHSDEASLPDPTNAYESIIAAVTTTLKARRVSQNGVCALLKLSPPILSMWLKSKDMPQRTRELYSSALESLY